MRQIILLSLFINFNIYSQVIEKIDIVNDMKNDEKVLNNTFFNDSFFQSLSTTLLGSLLGAGLAIPVGLWLDRKLKDKQKLEKIMSLEKLLKSELVENLKSLNIYLNSTSDFNLPKTYSSNWRILQSQNYLGESDKYEKNILVSNVYTSIQYIEVLTDKFLNLILLTNDSNYKNKIDLIKNEIDKEVNEVLDLIRKILNDQ